MRQVCSIVRADLHCATTQHLQAWWRHGVTMKRIHFGCEVQARSL